MNTRRRSLLPGLGIVSCCVLMAMPSLGETFTVGHGTTGTELAAFRSAHENVGGEAVLGPALGAVLTNGFVSLQGTKGHYQVFTNGSLQYHTNGTKQYQAFAVAQPLLDKWASYRYSGDPLGYPTGHRSSTYVSSFGTSYRYQQFEADGGRGGSVARTPQRLPCRQRLRIARCDLRPLGRHGLCPEPSRVASL